MLTWFARLPTDIRQYMLVTANYWTFTLTDGALRMLVVLYFYDLGYSPLAIAMLFIFYEVFGVITNLVGGWLGARLGLNKTMNIGLFVQIIALVMLLVPTALLTVPWVMTAQALSGIAKDLNKMSAKSAIKLLVPNDAQSQLYKWVAILTGSKNALKGVGFLLGGLLLSVSGFGGAVLTMAIVLAVVWLISIFMLKKDLGKAKRRPKFTELFSKSRDINYLSAARMFLFAARDVWFVVALPVYLSSQFGWDHWTVGGFLAMWVIGYGMIQSVAPRITGKGRGGNSPSGSQSLLWLSLLAIVTAFIALSLTQNWHVEYALLGGLLIFGALFAINSSLHSYLILSYSSHDGVSMDVGFYYMANAMGRLIGTVLSGWLYQQYGLATCLWVSTLSILLAFLISLALPKNLNQQS